MKLLVIAALLALLSVCNAADSFIGRCETVAKAIKVESFKDSACTEARSTYPVYAPWTEGGVCVLLLNSFGWKNDWLQSVKVDSVSESGVVAGTHMITLIESSIEGYPASVYTPADYCAAIPGADGKNEAFSDGACVDNLQMYTKITVVEDVTLAALPMEPRATIMDGSDIGSNMEYRRFAAVIASNATNGATALNTRAQYVLASGNGTCVNAGTSLATVEDHATSALVKCCENGGGLTYDLFDQDEKNAVLSCAVTEGTVAIDGQRASLNDVLTTDTDAQSVGCSDASATADGSGSTSPRASSMSAAGVVLGGLLAMALFLH